MATKPNVTDVKNSSHVNRLVLEITPPNALGEQEAGPTTDIVAVEGVIGSPEGRSLGSPGDLRIRQDTAEVYQKISGERTLTGWRIISGEGISLDSDSYSGAVVAFTPDLDIFLGFNAASAADNLSNLVAPLVELGASAEKIASASGRVTAVLLRTSLIDFALDVFVEISVAFGPFVRTVVATGLAVPFDTIVNVPLATIVSFGLTDRIRVGFINRGADDVGDLFVELQLSYP